MRQGVGRVLLAMLALGLASCGLAVAAAPTRFSGVVSRVSDGDTVWVQPDAAPGERGHRARIKVRLLGLDAPERCQAHGREAGAALAALVQGRHVEVQRRATDDYGRALGTLSLGTQDVGALLVRDGHAWSAHYRGAPGPYANEERAARAARRGLFAEPAPVEPWRFRRVHGACEEVGCGATPWGPHCSP